VWTSIFYEDYVAKFVLIFIIAEVDNLKGSLYNIFVMIVVDNFCKSHNRSTTMIIRVYRMDVQMWRSRFLISVINANDRISWVKPADIGQTMVNLGHHLENLVSNP
jgi:hypothetical protein